MKYFNEKISRGFAALYIAKTIVTIASELLGLFLPIFIYNLLGGNFQYTIGYFALGYLFYGFLVAWGAQFLNKFGFRRALRVSTFLGALFYAIFYFIDKDNLVYLLLFSIFVTVLFRLFHWVPYHVDFAKFTGPKDKAESISIMLVTQNIIGVFIPLIAGFIIVRSGFDILFLIAIIAYLISFIPYLIIPRTNEKFSWSYIGTWKRFLSKKRRKPVLAFFSDGAEGAVSMFVWPIFIYQVVKGDYLQVGLISSFIIAATVILQLIIGKYVDGYSKEKKVLKFGSILYAFGWILKIFITTAFHIFIIGAYHNLVKILLRTPFDAITYELAADEGHYVDEFTVIREMAINFGRFFMAVLIVIISLFFSIQWTFILAALAALAVNLLHRHDDESILRMPEKN